MIKEGNLKERLLAQSIIGPSLTGQIIKNFDKLDHEKIEWLAYLLDEAERARDAYGERSQAFLSTLSKIEESVMTKVQKESINILAEFEEELRSLKG